MKKRLLAGFMTAAMLLSLSPVSALAAEPYTGGLCPHHPQHTEDCGYIEAVEGQPCGHVHDEACGYVKAVPEVLCDMGCTDTDGDGVIDHAEGCAYTPAMAGAPCQHEHDELCGYVEAVEGHPCGYVCRVCPVQAMIDALPDGLDITPDNRAEVEAQLEAIGAAWAELSDEDALQLDTARCEAAQEALAALDGQEDNDLPTALVEGDVSYLYCDENGQNWTTGTCASATEVTASDTVWGTANTTTWYVVSGEITAPKRIMVNGDVRLILADGCHLDTRNGIGVLHNDNDAADVFANSLSIYAQSTGENMGRLTATSGDAGIGGQYRAVLRPGGGREWDFFDHDAGKITIFGGNITATGGEHATGIGGGDDGGIAGGGSCGIITIHGGNVTAKAGQYCGVDLGTGRSQGSVTITGGTVSATTIGGSVTATGGTVSARTIRGAFSTGASGSAILHVNSFTDTSNQSDWDCLVYQGSVGKVYGSPIFTSDASLPSDKSLTVEAGCSLNVAQGAILTVPEGTVIINQGTIQSNGTLVNNGAINNSGTISGRINNTNGTIYQTTGATLPDNVGGTVIQDVQTYGDLLVAGGTHGTDYTYENNTLTVLTSTPLTITGNTTQDRIVVNANVNASLTLSSLRINFSASQSTESPLTICGSADVTLVGSSALYGRGYVDINGHAGHAISVETNGSLTLKGSGSLSATGGHGKTAFQCNPSHGGAGIWNAGTLTIDGGQVELRGGTGGDEPNGFFAHGGAGVQGDVSISGGTVAITGGTGGSQITANPSGSGKGGIAVTGTLNMTGGTVSLRGGNRGSNNHGTSEQGGAAAGSVQISGGVLIATGGNDVKAITNEPTASGNCLVLANETTDNSTRTGTVHGSIALQENFTLDEKDTLTIPNGSTLTVDSGVTLTNSGTIQIDQGGTLTNSGTISGSGTITGDGTLNGTKAIPTYTLPTGLTATYGQSLNNVSLPDGWAWVNSSTSVGTVGTHQFSAKFTPGNTRFYAEVTKDLAIKVNKAMPVVSVSAASGLTYTGSAQALISGGNTTGGTLQYSTDNATWSTDLPTGTNAGSYTVYYKVDGGDNYNDMAAGSGISVTISKATPTVTAPTNLTATYGQTLANMALPSGWAWNVPTTSVGNVGDNSFPATYTRDNSGNYNTVQQNLTVTVSAAPRTITVTGMASSPTQITLNEAVIDPSGTGGTVSYGKNTTNTAPSDWQTGKEFSGLTADTTYYFFAKVEAAGNYAAAVSAGVAISTPAKAVSSIAIATQPTTLTYTSGQTLDLSGLSVTVTYNDNTTGTIEWSDGKLTADPAAGTALTVTGHHGKTVTISYGGKTATTNALTVTQGTQAAASITGAPATIYNGDSFTLTLSGGSGTGAVTWEIVSGPAKVDATTGKVTVTGTGEIKIKVVKAADTDYTQAEVTITLNATTRPTPPTGGGGGGGGYTLPTYKPDITKPSGGGDTPGVTPSNPKPGDTVTVTPKPDDGHEVGGITVTDKTGKPVEVTKKPDGTYTFKQPNGKVTIDVTYRPIDRPWNNPFSDVSESDWFYEAVKFVHQRGLMGGYGDGRFGPNDNLSRAQLAQILFNKEGRPGVNYLLTFSDVAGEAWYTEAIRWATSQGIVGGYGNGMFGPNDPITREQLAVMLWRYSGSPAATDKELHFNDADEISPFALEAMRWAVENGILNGYGDGRLGPQGQATRAQVAQMLKNFIEKQEESI